MPSYQYATNTGQLKTFDAPDLATATRSLSGFADRDPSSGIREIAAPASVLPGAGTASTPGTLGTPGTPATDYSKLATDAGAANLSYSDYSKLFTPTDEETKNAQDSIAKQFGYTDYNDFITKAFAAPSQSTQDFYNNAYSAAGLDQILSDITSKKDALTKALGTVNDNPWYDEAFRKGEAGRLQQLANGDISNLTNEYNLRLGHVKELVSQHASDLAAEDKLRQTQLQYLEKNATDAATKAAAARAEANLSSFASGKASATKPQTVSAPGTSNVYRYDPTNHSWNLVQKGIPKTTTPKSPAPTSEQKIVANFQKALANRNALNKAGTREQFIRQLGAQFPQIDPSSIAEYVYGTYPDHYNGQ